MQLDQSLGLSGEFAALYGEVVTYDVYEVRKVADVVSCNDPNYVHWKGHEGINFIPDTVLDLGANVGIFSRYARSLWPDAYIVAVEPNPANCAVFRYHTPEITGVGSKMLLMETAIGNGQMYHCQGAINGAHESYLSQGLGYNKLAFEELGKVGVIVNSTIKPVMLTDLKQLINGKVLLKLDIEGNETVIFNDPESMELMKTFDYICMELHYFAHTGETLEAVKAKTKEALDSLNETHNTRYDHIYFYATKR